MKKIMLWLIALTAISTNSFAQSYRVTNIKGSVLYNNKILKVNDVITVNAKLISKDQSAELSLFSLKVGKRSLSFEDSRPVVTKSQEKSELYELTVGAYLRQYDTEKMLAYKDASGFDFQLFLNDTADVHPVNRILIVEGQIIPARSNLMKITASDKYYICNALLSHNICNQISKIKGSLLLFNDQAIKGLINAGNSQVRITPCLFKVGYYENGTYKEQHFNDTVEVAVISKMALREVVGIYATGLAAYYHNNKKSLLIDVEADLFEHYGRFYAPEIERIIMEDLKRS